MRLVRPRYAYIERLTERLLAEARVVNAPVPVELMAEAKGCRIVGAHLRDVSGILVRSADGVTIGVNARQAPSRRRFTVAHEFGHFLLHEGQEVRYDHHFRFSLRSDASSAGTDIEEIEANFFAASLLMPDSILRRDPRTAFIDMDDDAAVGQLAGDFRVSRQAMALRLARLFGGRE